VVDADGRVLDGRHRLKACQLAGVEPRTVTVEGTDPLAYILGTNLARRNLSSGQRAVVMAHALEFQK
jgi:ParB-like chromosome segregation protein Spo0J